MTCTCGHVEAVHIEDQEVDLDGRSRGFGVFEQCAECVNEDRADSVHPFQCSVCGGVGWFFDGKPHQGGDVPCSACNPRRANSMESA